MKRNDIAIIVLIASVSVVLAYFLANALIGNPSSQSVKVKTAKPISTDITEPSSAIFNKDAINPTVEVEIGNR